MTRNDEGDTPTGAAHLDASPDHAARQRRHRVLIAQIAAAERWAREPDRTTATAPARRGLRAKFERQADPDGVLPPDERARRVDHLMRAHMLRMARRSAEARHRLANPRGRH